jgi:tryptophan 2,3-dioxygenase
MRVLVHKIDVMETMTPLDFLDFRDLLRPASGFQSMQFKILEAKLGLKMDHRHGHEYYTSQLRPEDKAAIQQLSRESTLLELMNAWLERMPFLEGTNIWEKGNNTSFWKYYRSIYHDSLGEGEKQNLNRFDDLFLNSQTTEGTLTDRARRAALFILLYRDYPLLQNPFRIINLCLEIDELLANWRWRHVNMVHRMIGTRTGTGGSSGKGLKHYVFAEFAELNSFMIERRKLPTLTPELERILSFHP